MVNKSTLKVIVGIPSLGSIRVETAVSLCNMLLSTPNVNFRILNPISSFIHHNREIIVQETLKTNADYLLFIDSDMIFPPTALNTLLSRNKDVIGVMYNYRTSPPTPTVKLDPKYKKECTVINRDGKIYGSITDESKPFRCKAVGTGFLLIKSAVFKKLERPYFTFTPESENNEIIGEDIHFCNNAQTAGYDIWCDPSIKMGHIGSIIY